MCYASLLICFVLLVAEAVVCSYRSINPNSKWFLSYLEFCVSVVLCSRRSLALGRHHIRLSRLVVELIVQMLLILLQFSSVG